MAHEVENMFSVKERPWHGLGTVLENTPSIEEGIKLAGLDWTVDLKEIAVDGNVIKGYKAAMRSDNQACLGTVTDKYRILQNEDAFKFFQPYLDTGIASLETAGCLKEGKRVWILARINNDEMVIDEKTNDRVEKFLLLSNAHDGSAAVRVGYTPIRVVCNNTLTAAEESVSSQLIRVTHRGDVVGTMEQVRTTMDVINRAFKATEQQYKLLASKANIKTEDLQNYVVQVFAQENNEKNKQLRQAAISNSLTEEILSKEMKKKIEYVIKVFEEEPVHNNWTAYNAVNHYINHARGRNLESAYNALWFESGKRTNKTALNLALAY